MRVRIIVVLALAVTTVVAAGCARLKTVAPPVVSLDEVTHPDPAARAYLTSVHQRIKARWTHPCVEPGWLARCAYPEGLAIMDVRLAKNGDLAFVDVVKSSGVPALDAAALQAVKAAAPFETVPAVLVEGDGARIRLRMRYAAAGAPLWP